MSVNRSYDVPYLGGSSKDGKTVYIDRRVPQVLNVAGKSVDPAKYLSVHETTENHLMTKQGLSYEDAHHQATTAERAAVQKDGLDWKSYEAHMDGLLSNIEHENPKSPPPDLYTKPYPHDKQELLQRRANMNQGLASYTLRRGGSVRVIAKGNVGNTAKQAQKHLKAAGLDVPQHGKFDDKTEAAVRSFQAKHGLPETGVVDPMTMGALMAAPKQGLALVPPPQQAPMPPMARGGFAGTPSPKRMHMPVAPGLIKSNVAGRTDRLPLAVPKNAYIVPADIPSGLGQGNSSAGGLLMDQILKPHRMHRPMTRLHNYAEGGSAKDESAVPILAAGGEYVVDPDTVMSIGGGDVDKGHRILDNFVLTVRKSTADRLNQLPGPKR